MQATENMRYDHSLHPKHIKKLPYHLPFHCGFTCIYFWQAAFPSFSASTIGRRPRVTVHLERRRCLSSTHFNTNPTTRSHIRTHTLSLKDRCGDVLRLVIGWNHRPHTEVEVVVAVLEPHVWLFCNQLAKVPVIRLRMSVAENTVLVAYLSIIV